MTACLVLLAKLFLTHARMLVAFLATWASVSSFRLKKASSTIFACKISSVWIVTHVPLLWFAPWRMSIHFPFPVLLFTSRDLFFIEGFPYAGVFMFRNVIQNHMQLCTSWLPSLLTFKGRSQPPWSQVAMPQMNSVSPKLAFDALRVSDEPETILHSYSNSPPLSLDLQEIRNISGNITIDILPFVYQEPKFCVWTSLACVIDTHLGHDCRFLIASSNLTTTFACYSNCLTFLNTFNSW